MPESMGKTKQHLLSYYVNVGCKFYYLNIFTDEKMNDYPGKGHMKIFCRLILYQSGPRKPKI